MLTNHTGRRTFATLLYKKGIMSNGQLMSLTGHSSETAFLRYLDITQEEISGVAMKLALNAFN
jgi:integrase